MTLTNQPSSLDEAERFLPRDPAASQLLDSLGATITTTTTVVASSPMPISGVTSNLDSGLASTTIDAAAQGTSASTGNDRGGNQSGVGDRTTVIILATVLSVFGCLVIGLTLWTCLRCRRRRRLFNRGITPIGDEEIETWKGHNRAEKAIEASVPVNPVLAPARPDNGRGGHQKQESASSVRKPPSVIVYARQSEELSPRSPSTPYQFPKMSLDGKRSFDKDLPLTPIQARAPNAREGLTDEAIPGDDPYIANPRRHPSRLTKGPRTSTSTGMGRLAHARNKSSRSSLSLRNLADGAILGNGYDSDHEMYNPAHSRISSDVPPRLSLSENWPAGGGGLSPRPMLRAEEIGRAIG